MNIGRWRAAWGEVVDEHEVLRTRLHRDEQGEFSQSFHSEGGIEFEYQDLRELPPGERLGRIEEFLGRDLRRGFDFTKDRLSRWHHFVLGEQTSWLVWTSHHAMMDGRSRLEVLKDVFTRYQTLAEGLPAPALSRPRFIDHIRAFRDVDGEASRAFWRTTLRGLESAVPLEFGFPGEPSARSGQPHGQQTVLLNKRLTQDLKELARSLGVTLNTLLQGAWALLLCRSTGHHDVVFGAPRACRHGVLPEGDRVIGLMTNTVPVRIDCREDQALSDWLKEIREQWIAMRPHEHLPLSQIEMESPLDPGTPLFESLVAFENEPLQGRLRSLGEPFTMVEAELRAVSHYPLVVSASGGEEIRIELTHHRRRFDDSTVSALLSRMVHLLRQFLEMPQHPLSGFSLLSADEATAVIGLLNPPEVVFDVVPSLVQTFARHAQSQPQAVAVEDGTRSLTYGELADQARRLSSRLQKAGAGPRGAVAVSAEQSLDMVVGILGALYAGASYVPVDPAEPRERLLGMLRDGGVVVVLLDRKHEQAFAPHGEGAWALLSYDEVLNVASDEELACGIEGSAETACILYTSGSSGRPKGVCVRHASIASLVLRTNYTHITREHVVAQAANCCFDAASYEIWGALLNGARLSLLPKECLLQADLLEDELTRRGITHLFLTTGLCHELARQRPWMFRSLHQLVVGGEVFRPEMAARILAHGPPARLTNGYGPTETTTFATWHDVSAHHNAASPLPIGRPVSRARVYVLDASLRVMPPGVPGELYIGGEGVATGYLHDPDLTVSRFVPSPFEKGARLYRTGDWVRILPNGELDFLGRRDGQAKIRGHRVEIGEVEAALLSHPGVQDAAVTIHQPDGTHAQASLVGHVVLHPDCVADEAGLRRFLRTKLHEYLVPGRFCFWDQFFLNRNGKVDRARLARCLPAEARTASDSHPPMTGTEVQVRDLWADLMPGRDFGIDEDFFELGGNSLQAMRHFSMVGAIFQVKLTPAIFFTCCTIRALAGWIDQTRARGGNATSGHALGDVSEKSVWPLSAQQFRLWEAAQQASSFGVWNITRRVRLRGTLDVASLRAGFEALVLRHDALRITLHGEAGAVPVQMVAKSGAIEISERDLTSLSATEQREELSRTAREQVWQPLDLGTCPFRILLLKTGTQEQVLMVTVHHCLCDGASLAIMLEDLAAYYTAFATGREPQLPPLSGQSVMLPEWEQRFIHSPDGLAAEAHWREYLAVCPPPVALPAVADVAGDAGLRGKSLTARLPVGLGHLLRESAQSLRTSPFSVFFAAFAVLVHGITSRGQFLVMTPFARRVEPWMQRLVCMFTNALPVSFDLAGELRFADLVHRTRDRLLETLQYQPYPASEIASMAQQLPSASRLAKSLVQLDFVEVPSLDIEHRFHQLHAVLEPVEHQTIRNDLRVMAFLSCNPVVIRFDFPMERFEEQRIAHWLEWYCRILEQVAADPSLPVNRILSATQLEFFRPAPACIRHETLLQ